MNYPKRVGCDTCSRSPEPCKTCLYKRELVYDGKEDKMTCPHCGGIADKRSDGIFLCLNCMWHKAY